MISRRMLHQFGNGKKTAAEFVTNMAQHCSLAAPGLSTQSEHVPEVETLKQSFFGGSLRGTKRSNAFRVHALHDNFLPTKAGVASAHSWAQWPGSAWYR